MVSIARRRARSEPAVILRGHAAPITALHFLPNLAKDVLLSGDEAGALHRSDLYTEEGELLYKAQNKSPVLNIEQRHDSLYIQYKSGLFLSLPLDRLTVPADPLDISLNSHLPFVSMCKFRLHPHSAHSLIYPDPDAEAALFVDLRDGAPSNYTRYSRQDAACKGGLLTAICPISESKFLAAYEDGRIARWDIRKPKHPDGPTVQTADDVLFNICQSPAASVAVAAGGTKTITAINTSDSNPMRRLREARLRTQGISDLAWRRDGRLIASGGWDGIVRLWSGKRTASSLLRPLASLRWHASNVRTVAFSGDSRWLASGGEDRTIAAWRVYQNEV